MSESVVTSSKEHVLHILALSSILVNQSEVIHLTDFIKKSSPGLGTRIVRFYRPVITSIYTDFPKETIILTQIIDVSWFLFIKFLLTSLYVLVDSLFHQMKGSSE